MDWQKKALSLKFEQKKSWAELTKEIKTYFPTLDDKQVLEKVRGYIRKSDEYKKVNPIREKTEVIGVFSDTHLPFVHPNFIYFIQDTFEAYGVTRIIHDGDLVDNHAISRFQTETDADSPKEEHEKAQKQIELYAKAFPSIDILLGNHDLIPQRQAASLGIPTQFLKSFSASWNLPKEWTVHEQLIINDVLYEHGTGTSGKNGALDKAINAMMSCVIGHSHSFGGVQYKSNSKSLIFGLNVGCGVDIDALAFRYGKYNKNRETLGCGIVLNSSEAYFVPMNDRYFRK